MSMWPDQGGGDGLPFKAVTGAVALLVFLTCVFLQLQGYGVFEWVSERAVQIGSAIESVLDELWEQPS